MRKAGFSRALTAAALISNVPVIVLEPAPAAALPVFDATNYTQNLIQAARALEQINNQVRSLQNEATMLQNMARNLQSIDFPELKRLQTAMGRIDRLMAEARGIGFEAEDLDERIRKLFPVESHSGISRDQRIAKAKARLDAARKGFEDLMELQAGIAANVREDNRLLSDFVQRSQGAQGSLEVEQASNQLLALSIKQQLQLQQLMAAEFRGAAFDRARKVQAEEAGRAATRRFLGNGSAGPTSN